MPYCRALPRKRCCWRFLVCVMTVFLSRTSRVLGGWIRGNSHTRQTVRSIPAAFHSPTRVTSPRRQFQTTSSSLKNARWDVGDSVQVRIDDELINARVIEARGRGWYDVQLADDSNTSIKCRSSQLLPCTFVAPLTATIETFTAQNRTRPKIMAENGTATAHVSPPPTIHDLDAAILSMDQVSNLRDIELLEQVKHHSSFEKWVAFTDLHCSPASLDTCLKVLTEVHRVALDNNAGVLFLGDFWHHRGTLRVDCLNAILEHFRTWEVPMIMIPGNHDQVTLGGHSHGLTPIENAYRVGSVAGPLVLSYPTRFRNALFIPHIRDIATMESVLRTSTALECSSLFIHAEVTGALMNDQLVSTGGVPPGAFPPNKRIYSGHFHKPHTVKSANADIEYLGSPYETSLAEAQQQKMLAILDKDWKCIKYHRLSIGRRHFKVSTWKDLLTLQLPTAEVIDHYHSQTVKAGDRVVVSIPKEDAGTIQSSVGSHLDTLREAGVTVEIREIKVAPLDRSELLTPGGLNEEMMSPESTWRAYLDEEAKRLGISEDNAEILLARGFDILEEIESTGEVQVESNDATDLRLHEVSVEGFGPFQDLHTYPLFDRGLVLLKGTNLDGGSDSNGSGKSSLAMAALWALTGSMDPRRAQDGKVADVINDNSKVAKATLEGSINGLSFTIARTKTATKGGLYFHLDGQDLTTQSPKETQAIIEEKLGVSSQILSRTMFHGQHALNDLLESTDAKFKEELSLIVPLDLWQKASASARKKSREATKSASELTGMIKIRSEDVDTMQSRREIAERKLQEKTSELIKLKEHYDSEIASVVKGKTSEGCVDSLEETLRKISPEIKFLEGRHSSLVTERNSELSPLQRSLVELNDSLGSLTERCHFNKREVFAATSNLESARETIKRLEQKWSVDLSNGRPTELLSPAVCPTCSQPVAQESTSDDHSHANLQTILEEEISTCLEALKAAEASLETSKSELSKSKESRLEREKKKSVLVENIERATALWDTQISTIERELVTKRQEFALLSEEISNIAKDSQIVAKQDAANAAVRAGEAAVEYATEVYSTLCQEINEGEKRLNILETEMEEQMKSSRIMSDLGERFGQRGVQTFVLQNVVGTLETISQIYLDDLSDGAQRLNLSLDAGDRILRTAFVIGANGVFKKRPLSTLSGGQWRRCSLALTFAFAELVARRGKLRPSLCVLDEPLTHLDRSGRTKVGEVIRGMLRSPDSAEFRGFGGLGMSTVLIILQDLAAEELGEAFDCIDEVVKVKSESYVKVDGLLARES